MRKIAFLFLVFFLLPCVAQADMKAATTPEGAIALKKLLDDNLQWRLDMAKMTGSGLAMGGKIDVKPADGFYLVTLPDLSLSSIQSGEIKVGTVTLHMTPAEKPGAWVMQITLPDQMTFIDATGKPATGIHIENQQATATWLPDKDILTNLDFLLNNIQVKGMAAAPATGRIDSFKALISLTENGDGTFSGPVDFTATGINVNVPGAAAKTIDIGKVSSHNDYDHLDISQMLKMKQTAKVLLKNGPPKTAEEKHAMMPKLLMNPSLTAGSITGKFEADKLSVNNAATQLQPARQFGLEQLVFSAATTDAEKEKSKVLVTTSFDGLRVSPVSDALADFVPQKMNANITFENVPLRKITDTLFSMVQKSAAAQSESEKEQVKTDTASIVALIPQMLRDAGASVSIDNTSIKSAALDTAISGKLNAANPPLGVVGKIVVMMTGLDEAAHKLQRSALKAGADPNTLGYLGAITIVQMRGASDKAANGKSIRSYTFDLMPDGKVILNGTQLYPSVNTTTTAPSPPMMISPKIIHAPATHAQQAR